MHNSRHFEKTSPPTKYKNCTFTLGFKRVRKEIINFQQGMFQDPQNPQTFVFVFCEYENPCPIGN